MVQEAKGVEQYAKVTLILIFKILGIYAIAKAILFIPLVLLLKTVPDWSGSTYIPLETFVSIWVLFGAAKMASVAWKDDKEELTFRYYGRLGALAILAPAMNLNLSKPLYPVRKLLQKKAKR